MNILITGGAGFIGSHLVERLVHEGHTVAVIDDLSNGNLKNLDSVRTKVHFYRGSITSSDLDDVFAKEKPEVVFHLAAHINVRNSLKDPQHDATVNILGSLNLLENCRVRNVQKVIFSSTGGAIYGEAQNIPTPETEQAHPISHYAVSKFTVEQYLYLYRQVYGLNYVILRYANVYGPRQDPIGEAGVVAIFIKNILDGKDCRINGDGMQTRDYIFVGDVVQANMLALATTSQERVFNIATGREISVNDLYEMISNSVQQITKKKTKRVHGPSLAGEVTRSCLNCSRAQKELGWKPQVSLAQGIHLTATAFSQTT